MTSDTSTTVDAQTTVEGIPTATEATIDRLNQRQLLDYRHHRTDYIQWLLTLGKNPEQFEGYTQSTARTRADKHDQFCRWVWDEYDGYTLSFTHDHADAYLKHLAFSDLAQSSRPTYQKALLAYFRWKAEERGGTEWKPDRRFTHRPDTSIPREYFDREERRLLREAALEYGSIPHYNNVTPDERRRWKQYLARRLQKPIEEVSKADWERVNGWKYASMVWTGIDAALRPIEVERATVEWVDTDRGILRIPRSASKNDVPWEVALTERTTMALTKWLQQRSQYERYDGRDELWLTKYGNPYGSRSLSRIVSRLCEIAEIPTQGREDSWYAIRRGTITDMVDEGDLSSARQQARHKDPRSTMRYDQAPTDRRRDILERL